MKLSKRLTKKMSKPRRQKVRVCASRETLRNIVQDKILRKRERLTLSEAADLKMIKISVLLRWLREDETEISETENSLREKNYDFVSDLCLANTDIWKSFKIPRSIEIQLKSVVDSVLDCAELHSPPPTRNKRGRSVSAKLKRASHIASILQLDRRQKSILQSIFLNGGRRVEDALLRFESGNFEPVQALLSSESTSKRLHETLSNQMSIDMNKMSIDMDALSILGSGSNVDSLTLSKEGGSLGGSFGVTDEVEDPKPGQSRSRGGCESLFFCSFF